MEEQTHSNNKNEENEYVAYINIIFGRVGLRGLLLHCPLI